jgi:hypothetical protein
MVSVDRYSVLDIAGKYLLLILKPSSCLKLDILMPFRRDLPGSKVPKQRVANYFLKLSARSTKAFCCWR